MKGSLHGTGRQAFKIKTNEDAHTLALVGGTVRMEDLLRDGAVAKEVGD